MSERSVRENNGGRRQSGKEFPVGKRRCPVDHVLLLQLHDVRTMSTNQDTAFHSRFGHTSSAPWHTGSGREIHR
jgi:hypothetical protein